MQDGPYWVVCVCQDCFIGQLELLEDFPRTKNPRKFNLVGLQDQRRWLGVASLLLLTIHINLSAWDEATHLSLCPGYRCFIGPGS